MEHKNIHYYHQIELDPIIIEQICGCTNVVADVWKTFHSSMNGNSTEHEGLTIEHVNYSVKLTARAQRSIMTCIFKF